MIASSQNLYAKGKLSTVFTFMLCVDMDSMEYGGAICKISK